MYKIYVLIDNDGKLYKGMTNDLDLRLREHKNGKTRTTSRMKNCELAYSEAYEN